MFALTLALSATAATPTLAFEANHGQLPAEVKFVARCEGYRAFVTGAGVVLDTGAPSPVTLELRGARTPREVVGELPLPGTVSYFTGPDPSRWRTGVPTYARVRLREVYPGIDLVLHGSGRALEYDFELAPNTDASLVRFAFAGANRVRLRPSGDLELDLGAHQLRALRPRVYELAARGARIEVPAAYALDARGEVRFRVARRDRSRPLLIDPEVLLSKFFGGTGDDTPHTLATDALGNVWVAGETVSIDFPVTDGGAQRDAGMFVDAFVFKLDAQGATVFSTYLGGTGQDRAHGIAVDPSGNATVGGETNSLNFPTTAGALRGSVPSNAGDGFVTRLSPTGGMVYSTYLGGTSIDMVQAVAVDDGGTAYLTGSTLSTDFPAVNAWRGTLSDGGDDFVARLSATGATLLFSTFVGGDGSELPAGIAVDGAGGVYVTGNTTSLAFPTVSPVQPAQGGGGFFDAFVLKLTRTGAPVYATYLGGSGDDRSNGIAVDALGAAYVTGQSASSATFPRVPGTNPAYGGGGGDVFVTKLDPTGATFVYSTFIGGGSLDIGHGIAVDPAGCAQVVGGTSSMNFPTVDALLTVRLSPESGFVSRLNASGTALLFSSYFARPLGFDDPLVAVAVDPNGLTWMVGKEGGAGYDALVTRLDLYSPGTVGMSPQFGTVSGGTGITVDGSSLLPGAGVQVGGVSATSVNVVSATQVTAVTPPHAPGLVAVTLTNPGGGRAVAVDGGFLYVEQPAITAVMPPGVPLAGGPVIVLGTGIAADAGLFFGGAPSAIAPTVSDGGTIISGRAPPHAAGTVDVRVVNPPGVGDTRLSALTYADPPTVSAVSPTIGPGVGGQALTLTGTNFAPGASVVLGGAFASNVGFVSATSLIATSPAHAGGIVDVSVVNPDQQSGALTNGYTFIAGPMVASVTPTSGPTAGGTPIAIDGMTFVTGSTVAIGGAPATDVVVVSATRLTAVAPPHGAGRVDVAVTNPDGQTATLAMAFTYFAPPQVGSVVPSSGPATGGQLITISGLAFQPNATLLLGDAPASQVVVAPDGASLTARAPVHAGGVVDVVVRNTDGQEGRLPSGFMFIDPPKVVTVDPKSGPTEGGTALTLSGTGFNAGSRVLLGGAEVATVFDGQLTAVTPPHAAGSVDVTVINTDGQTDTLTEGFTYSGATTAHSHFSFGCSSAGDVMLLAGALALVRRRVSRAAR